MKHLTSDQWIRIKTDYEFGDKSIRQIAGEYGITDTAIRLRIKKENWTQKLRMQVIDIKKNIEKISQQSSREQLPYVQDKLNEVLDLSTKVKSYLSTAIDVNLRNIQEVAKEPDVKDRIRLMSLMRANMSDLANVYPTTVKEADKEEKQEDKVINLIME